MSAQPQSTETLQNKRVKLAWCEYTRIAAKAFRSLDTVAAVYNGHKPVMQLTYESVANAARELGYPPPKKPAKFTTRKRQLHSFGY